MSIADNGGLRRAVRIEVLKEMPIRRHWERDASLAAYLKNEPAHPLA